MSSWNRLSLHWGRGITAAFDLAAIADLRASWGVFRDRRVDLYGALRGLDGQ